MSFEGGVDSKSSRAVIYCQLGKLIELVFVIIFPNSGENRANLCLFETRRSYLIVLSNINSIIPNGFLDNNDTNTAPNSTRIGRPTGPSSPGYRKFNSYVTLQPSHVIALK